jgi:hypothetical protein
MTVGSADRPPGCGPVAFSRGMDSMTGDRCRERHSDAVDRAEIRAVVARSSHPRFPARNPSSSSQTHVMLLTGPRRRVRVIKISHRQLPPSRLHRCGGGCASLAPGSCDDSHHTVYGHESWSLLRLIRPDLPARPVLLPEPRHLFRTNYSAYWSRYDKHPRLASADTRRNDRAARPDARRHIRCSSTASEIPPSGSRHLFETCQPTLS